MSSRLFCIGITDDAPPCLDQVNADGGDDVKIGDATYIVKFIFQGGDFPICGTTGQ